MGGFLVRGFGKLGVRIVVKVFWVSGYMGMLVRMVIGDMGMMGLGFMGKNGYEVYGYDGYEGLLVRMVMKVYG